MFVYTMQPVVKPVVKPDEQPVGQPVECLYTRYSRLSNRLSNRLDNRFDKRMYRVKGIKNALTSKVMWKIITLMRLYHGINGTLVIALVRLDSHVHQIAT